VSTDAICRASRYVQVVVSRAYCCSLVRTAPGITRQDEPHEDEVPIICAVTKKRLNSSRWRDVAEAHRREDGNGEVQRVGLPNSSENAAGDAVDMITIGGTRGKRM
jgi:hypothetical protein